MNEKRASACFIFFWALLALLIPGSAVVSSQNDTNLTVEMNTSLNQNLTPDEEAALNAPDAVVLGKGKSEPGRVLRAGFQGIKSINDLDVYGNRSIHVIPPQVPAQWAFDISQRVGNVSRFSSASEYKPIYNITRYSRTKAIYQAPSTLSSRPVYSISGYSPIKIASSIP